MKTKITILTLAICFALSNCADHKEKTIVNVLAIANKTIEEVNSVLGKPDTIIKINPIIKVNPVGTPNETIAAIQVFYKNKNIVVVFIDDLSDWITIKNISNLQMSEYIITALGLPQTNPRLFNPTSHISWEEVYGIKEISFFSVDSSMVDNIYIRVNNRNN